MGRYGRLQCPFSPLLPVSGFDDFLGSESHFLGSERHFLSSRKLSWVFLGVCSPLLLPRVDGPSSEPIPFTRYLSCFTWVFSELTRVQKTISVLIDHYADVLLLPICPRYPPVCLLSHFILLTFQQGFSFSPVYSLFLSKILVMNNNDTCHYAWG